LSQAEAGELAQRVTKTLTTALVDACSGEELAFIAAHWTHAALDDCQTCRRFALDWLFKLGRQATIVAAARQGVSPAIEAPRPS
jgi:hypothetical protein